MSLKGNHLERYISTNKLRKALKTLKQLGNEYYQFVEDVDILEERFDLDSMVYKHVEDMVLTDEHIQEAFNNKNEEKDSIENSDSGEDAEENKETDEEEDKQEAEYNNNDSIKKWQFQYNRSTFFTSDYPEADVKEDGKNITNPLLVAPGEGKVPTNILNEKDWDVKSFPGLHPDGKMGIHQPRKTRLTMQQYFEQRIMNYDRRFANTAAYVFGAFACLEKNQLDRNINISFMRGTCKKSSTGQSIYSLDDPYSVLDNSPGTPRYWQKKKYELIARLENLGPFQFFFTLSCADKRWNENFTTFLQDHELRYIVINGIEECTIDGMTIDDFLQQHEGKHEFIRKNILSATLNFNHRVKEFIKTIIMNKNKMICMKYYNYRVEFQLRGAAHVHGTLWIDWEKLTENFQKNSYGNLKRVFNSIKEESFGKNEDRDGLESLQNFIDEMITCSLKDPSTYTLVKSVQQHKHFSQSCYTRGSNCRFNFPKFPCIKTIIAIPSNIKYSHNEELESEMVKKCDIIKKKVKDVLENNRFMDEATKFRQDEIDRYTNHKNICQKIETLQMERRYRRENDPPSFDEDLLREYNIFLQCDCQYKEMLDNNLENLKILHIAQMEDIPVYEIEKERLDLILLEAEIEGGTFEERN